MQRLAHKSTTAVTGARALLPAECRATATRTTPPPAPTYAYQDKLPSLPVPPLEETLAKYLRSLQPFEMLGIFSPEEMKRTRALAEEFKAAGGRGQRLQSKLVARSQQKRNWLEEWWLKYAYNIWRCPTPVNVSYYFLFDEKVQGPERPDVSQSLVASLCIKGVLDFKAVLDKQGVPAEMMRGTVPLDMSQYSKLFTTARYPQQGEDYIATFEPEPYVLVLSNKQFYVLDVLDKASNRALTVKELQAQIERILQASQESNDGLGVGILTGEDRDKWAKARQELVSISATNARNLDVIDKALFVLCLDEESPRDVDTAGHLCLVGNGENRWYDKIVQYIVFKNGRGGLNGEHTPIDAPTAGAMTDHMLRYLRRAQESSLPSEEQSVASDLRAPTKLQWTLSPSLRTAQEEAVESYGKVGQDVDFRLLHFRTYGADWIKEKAKLSPDSYVQMALQLAYYKLYHTGTATYETGQTRQFYHGRTETVRSFCAESVEWTKAMTDASAPKQKRIDLLRKAIEHHSKALMADATNARGVDRHLLGLKLVAMEDEEEKSLGMPELFKDRAYAESSTFRLSTSNMPGKLYISGFGPVAADGYGVCYGTRNDMLQFTITSLRSCPTTDSARMRETLHNTLVEMGALFADAGQAKL